MVYSDPAWDNLRKDNDRLKIQVKNYAEFNHEWRQRCDRLADALRAIADCNLSLSAQMDEENRRHARLALEREGLK